MEGVDGGYVAGDKALAAPAACSFPGEKARSWEALGEARPGQSSISAGALRLTPLAPQTIYLRDPLPIFQHSAHSVGSMGKLMSQSRAGKAQHLTLGELESLNEKLP